MFGPVTPEKAIYFTRLSVALTCCWPLSSTASRGQLLCFKIIKFLVSVSAFALLLPLLYAIRVHCNDPIILPNVICLTVAVGQILIHVLLCMVHNDRIQVESAVTRPGSGSTDRNLEMVNRSDVLQAVIEEMTDYCQRAKFYERRVFQQYLDTYSTFYGVCATWFYTSASVVVMGTFFLSQPFPTPAEYPFPVDYEPLRTIVFLHQSVVGIQCAASMCINVFCALLILFAAARFEILMVEMRAVRDVRALIKCVKKYYHVRSLIVLLAVFDDLTKKRFPKKTLLGTHLDDRKRCREGLDYLLSVENFCIVITTCVTGYAQKVVSVVQYMDLVTVIVVSLPLVICGLNIVGVRQTLTVKIQFLFLGGTTSVAVFMCALSAHHLMQVSEDTLRSLYESMWYDQDVVLQKTIVRAIVPLKPVTISIACVIPVLSLQYYCSYIANAFSLFTALRIVMADDEQK
ncbi:uncharacterized protein LOC143149689 [Ptiloglossa arizonensis]|uniref:uncharacterized protein LOC143149689 n=1 Tax=Ptiloglossa arizonensis TaxID=3350558 RepID=UPI003FA159F1